MAESKWSGTDEEKLFWSHAAAYVADAVGLLAPDKRAELDRVKTEGGQTWQVGVEEDLAVTPEFVRAVFDLSVKHAARFGGTWFALRFILGGLGCPCTEERLSELGL